MTTPTDDLLAAMNDLATAYRNRWNTPPPPLLVPQWVVELAEAEQRDLDAMARQYGFDGYTVFDVGP